MTLEEGETDDEEVLDGLTTTGLDELTGTGSGTTSGDEVAEEEQTGKERNQFLVHARGQTLNSARMDFLSTHSITKTVCPGLIASSCISKWSTPYSFS